MTGEAAQRHRVALLALLAVTRDAMLPREKLMALLWPEHGDREARHLLNVAVHVLRKALGEEVLRTEGGDLRLDTGILSSDVARFRDALARGALREAIDAYSGPLLDGFFLDGSPEFDRWEEAERSRLEGEFTSALESLAEESERSGDWPQAVTSWQALWNTAPEHDRITLRLMQALEARGDRGGALRAADAHADLLAREFGAGPSPAVTALAARIRDEPGPVMAVAETRRAARPASTASISAAALAAKAAFPRWDRRLKLLAFGLGAASLVALAFGPWRTPDRTSVAVLPFVDMSPARDQAHLGDGLTEELLNALARVPGLRVAARSSSFQFRNPGVDARYVGTRLGVEAVVEGSVRRDGNRLRVTAQLIETRRGYHLWSEQYDRRVEDVFAVQEEIARTVARALGAELGRQVPDTLVPRATANPRAYDLYLRGRYDWNGRTTDGMWRALRSFEEAVALDPRYAQAYAGLSDTWQLLPDYGSVNARDGLARAKTAALRALALDSTLAEAHASLGALKDDYDRDRAGAERQYRRAILLNPAYATARQWLAIHLADEGRNEEAAAEIERARRLDPLSRIINTAVGAIRYFARDYASSIAEYRAVVDQAPDFALGWALMGRVYLVQGRVDSAVTTLRRAVELSKGDPSYVAVYAAALAAAGRRAESRTVAEGVRNTKPDAYIPYCELASAYVYLGEDATALDLFERGFEERDPAIKHLAVEPLYDRIRGHARFRALVQRAGLT